MKPLRAIRDSRKYFLTFFLLVTTTFFYVRLDQFAEEYEDRQENFKIWAWIAVAIGGAYIGAQAYQNSMLGDPHGGGDIIINQSKSKDIPDEK